MLPETTLGRCTCGAIVFKVSRYKGYVYVMSTKGLRGGIVKIGRTRGLSKPAIPTNYVTLAYFGSSNPVRDKARVAKKLAKYYNVGKEHYRLEPRLAVAEIRTTLRRDPLYVLPSLRTKYEATLESAARNSSGRCAESGTRGRQRAQSELGERVASALQWCTARRALGPAPDLNEWPKFPCRLVAVQGGDRSQK